MPPKKRLKPEISTGALTHHVQSPPWSSHFKSIFRNRQSGISVCTWLLALLEFVHGNRPSNPHQTIRIQHAGLRRLPALCSGSRLGRHSFCLIIERDIYSRFLTDIKTEVTAMSAFCVYGMTDVIAKLSASMKFPPRDREGSREAFYEEFQEHIYQTSAHRQVSPTYDAPQFCHDWIELAKKTMRTRGLRIMCRGQKIVKHGAPRINKKTKEPVIGWVPYEQ